MWLFKTLRPAHKTIADCRKHTRKPLRQVCREFPLLGKPLDLLAGVLGAIDGSTCKAVNAKERTVTAATLTPLLLQLAHRVAGSLKDLDGPESEDDAGPPGGAVAANVRRRSRRSSTA